MYKYHKFHPSFPDCLIAATSIVINTELFTFNKKHFTFYEGIKLYKQKYSHEASPAHKHQPIIKLIARELRKHHIGYNESKLYTNKKGVTIY